MTRIPVSGSTAISAVGYDPVTATMEVEFTSGRVYAYFGVPPQEYTAFMAEAETGSAGAYFTANIQRTYRYERREG